MASWVDDWLRRGDGWADRLDELSGCDLLRAEALANGCTRRCLAEAYASLMARRQGFGWNVKPSKGR